MGHLNDRHAAEPLGHPDLAHKARHGRLRQTLCRGMMPEIVVTKLDAAIRLLNCAVEQYFENGDPAVIYTLAFAAHQVISDINRFRNGPLLLFDSSKINRKDGRKIIAELRRHA